MSGFDNWNPNYVPYTPPAQGGGRKRRKGRKGKDPEVAKRRAARKALIAQHKAERAARKAERKRRAAARKAAAIVRRQQAAIRRAERKRIAEQKRLERLEKAQIRKQRIEERRKIAAESKIEREKARHLAQERRAARKALTTLRKKTMGGGDTQYRVSIVDANNDLPYVEDTEATRLWGVPDGLGGMLPLDGEVVFDDVSDVNLLLKKGKERLEKLSTPQVSYEADVVSLGKTGFSADAVGVGDAVQIVDTTFNPPIRVEGRVLKIEEDLLGSPDATRVTLGSIQETLSQRREVERKKIDNLISQSSEWNSAASNEGVYVRDLISRLNEVLNARGGYTYFTPNAGLFVYDKSEDEHPTTVTHIGGGFWRIADSLKPNGDWDWKNVCDGHGLFANRIYTGILSDAVGKNFWNLDTGEFSLQASAKIGGKTVQQIVDDSADGVISKMNESLTQEAIFNKLTNGGQTQGIYLTGGRVYLNASYLRTGIIRGERGTWDLNNGIISMWDADMHETVHLDGNGKNNVLIGAFRTSRPGDYGVSIVPDFDTTQIGDDYYHGLGAGITFTMPNHDYNAVIATEGESNDGKTLSSLWVTNGRGSKHEPGCNLEMLEAEDDGKYAFARLVAYGDYDDKNATISGGVRASSFPSGHRGGGYARLFSSNGREECFVEASVSNGEIYFNGALGDMSNRNTFVAYHWLAEKGGMDSRQHDIFDFETGCPAKYGCYYAIASSDTDWGAINCHVALTGRASGWKVGLENNLKDECPVDVYINTFGWLVNRNMG